MLLLAGCGKKTDAASDLAYVQEKGTLVVGITDYAPMDYRDDSGAWTGFDAEFALLIGEKLGVKVEFFELADWDSKFLELDAKNIDCIWNGMTITDRGGSGNPDHAASYSDGGNQPCEEPAARIH